MPIALERIRDEIARKRVYPILHADRARAPYHDVRRFLVELEHGRLEGQEKVDLFHPEFPVGGRGCHLASRFRKSSLAGGRPGQHSTGEVPRRYVERLRLMVCEVLLRETGSSLRQITPLVGYRDAGTLARAFKRLYGMSPSEHRRRTVAPREGRSSMGGYSLAELADAVSGRNPERARELGRYLLDLHGEELDEECRLEALDLETEDASELQRADAFWQTLQPLSDEARKERARASDFATPGLFQLLRRKAREAGRGERRHRVALAEVALESVRASRFLMPERLCRNLAAMAWTDLGVARRLALDLPGAARAFDEAEELLLCGARDRLVVAYLLHSRAGLCWYQGEHERGLRFADQAIRHFEQVRSRPNLLAEALIMRGAISKAAGYLPVARDDFFRSLAILEDQPGAEQLKVKARLNAARTLLESGCDPEAEAMLPATEKLARSAGLERELYEIRWIQGLVESCQGNARAAQSNLEEARDAFARLGDTIDVAAVSIDLAAVHIRVGRFAEALGLLTGSLPALDALRAHREGLAAWRLISQASEAGTLPSRTLEEARRHLERLRMDPVAMSMPARVAVPLR